MELEIVKGLNRRSAKINALREFCLRVRKPQFVIGNYLVLKAKLICYCKDRLYEYRGEVGVISGGVKFGTMRFDPHEEYVMNTDIYELLASKGKRYLVGRSPDILVIERGDFGSGKIHRLDLEEIE